MSETTAHKQETTDDILLRIYIERYERLIGKRNTLRDLSGHNCMTTMSQFLSYAEPEKLEARWLTVGLLDVLVRVRGDVHEEIKKTLEKIARLLYRRMRPEVDKMVALKKEQEAE